jgi:hypothetical protein
VSWVNVVAGLHVTRGSDRLSDWGKQYRQPIVDDYGHVRWTFVARAERYKKTKIDRHLCCGP